MAKLKVPSLQHLARNWKDDSKKVCKTLVNLANHPPTFTYFPLFAVVRDLLVFGQSFDQIVEGITRGIKRKDVRENFLGLLPLIRDHFEGVAPTFVQAVDRRFYPIKQGLMVPFEPPMIYGVNGQLFFPWFSFWRGNPLDEERLSLFVTIVDQILSQDPDLESAHFQILDFSAEGPDQPRNLNVYDAEEIPRISETQMVDMLSIFAEGYFLAETELSSQPSTRQKEPPQDDDKAQLRLFENEPKS